MSHVTIDKKVAELGDVAFASRLRDEVYKLAAEQPDYIYADPDNNGCYYSYASGQKDGPGCIVGQAMYRMGVCVRNLDEKYESDSATICSILLHYAPKCSNVDRIFLSTVQNAQDSGRSWEEAVAWGEERSLGVTNEIT